MLSTPALPSHAPTLKGNRIEHATTVQRHDRCLKCRRCAQKTKEHPFTCSKGWQGPWMKRDRLGFAAVFTVVAPPPHQDTRSHSETSLSLLNKKPISQSAKSESPLKKWPALWKRSVNRGIGNFKLDFPNYHFEIALKENWQECGRKRHLHIKEPPLARLGKEQFSQKAQYSWKS